jgi:hypothetical protein
MLIKTVLRILGVVAPSCAIYIFCHKFLLSSLDQLPLSIILAILMLLLLYLEAHDESHDESHDEAHEKLQGDMTETERQILNYCVEPKSTPELLKLLGYSTIVSVPYILQLRKQLENISQNNNDDIEYINNSSKSLLKR